MSVRKIGTPAHTEENCGTEREDLHPRVIVRAAGSRLLEAIHGDVWEYIRNDVFNANDYFSKLNGKKKAEYRQNQFGGTVGGPVVIRHIYNGRDKTFFFFDFQSTRTINPVAYTDTVPTAHKR